MTIWILWAVLLGIIGWMGFNFLRLRQAAKIVDNGEFEGLIRQGQLVDRCSQYSISAAQG